MPKLNWKLLTKKRSSSTLGLPPGKEDLAWVTNTVTLIYGERDAVLVDTFLSLHPRAVVAGHGVLDPDSSSRHIGETRNYIRDFNTSVASTSTAMELYEKMLTLHPNRVNPGSLWGTAKAVKPAA